MERKPAIDLLREMAEGELSSMWISENGYPNYVARERMDARPVSRHITLDDAAVVAVVDKLVKQRKDSIAAYEQAARQDLAEKEKAEMAVLQTYLPARMSEAEIAAAVQGIAAAFESEHARKPAAADMGKLMASAKAQLAGKADMGAVSAAVKAVLSA